MASLRPFCLVALPSLLLAHRCVHDRVASLSSPAVTALHTPDTPAPRSLASSTSLSPLRISFVYPFPLSQTLSSTEESLIRNSLLPAAAARLSALYSLPTATSPLFAHRSCLRAGLLGGVYVCTSYAATTYCADGADEQLVAFSASQLGADDVYSQSGRKTTLPSGAGTANTDFGVFVTAVSTSACTSGGGSDVLAYAITCQRDANDRPTWGRVNICPSSISLDAAQYRTQLYTIIHELTHALGFTSESYALFRDDAGLPRTPRNPADSTVPDDRFLMTYACPLDGNVYAAYFASPSTVKYVPERGMQCAWSADAATAGVTTASFLPFKDGKTDLSDCVARFVTPALTAASQSWMGCASLGGTEIENDNVDCSFYGSHVEQRVLPGELMSSYISHWPVITPHSPAFFADSGWYAVNYSAADPVGGARSETGLAQGCAYATGKCAASNAGAPPAWALDPAGHSGSTNVMCTQDRRAIAYTQTSTYASALPTQYQYFSSNPALGGSLGTADYCPVVWAYSNGLCSVVANGAASGCASDGSCTSSGETFGPSSACLLSSLATSGGAGRGAGCYKIMCAPDASYALVKLAGVSTPVNCSVGGAVMSSGSSALRGSFTCPDPTAVCGKPRTIDIAAQLATAAVASTPTPSPSPIAAAGLPAIKIAILLRISGMDPASVSGSAQTALATALTAWLGATVSAVGVVPVFAADDAALSAARLLHLDQPALIVDGPRLATSRAANARARERNRAAGVVDGTRRAAAGALAGASFQFSVSASAARSSARLSLSVSASWATTAESVSKALAASLASSSSVLATSSQWTAAAAALGISPASLSAAATLDPTRPVTAVGGSLFQESSESWSGGGAPGTGTKTKSTTTTSASGGLNSSATTWIAVGIAAAVVGLTGLSMCVRHCANKASAASEPEGPALNIRQTQVGGHQPGGFYPPPRPSGVYV